MLCYYAECDCAECRILFTINLNVNVRSVIMLNVVKLCVVMLSVVAPFKGQTLKITFPGTEVTKKK